ncbi:MAG: helix-turn-helix transcriptional regulator [Oscillospiraceae bacterium]|nr:helix-turn-helix transcriptional regulator [Oscillospiraceae bacterium]MBR5045489.1 helix-turn-helix transcriptional regulator [Oscillospiraceae bacterium]MBR5071367.1 helix-turn-helix transcriptional regulator [Oscillospiraceae bacterium]
MQSNTSFSRILTLLRKERGLTQKEAAANLGISQALLSHYEKGIRECGLDFVVKASEYYGVSCDYLLGRSPDRSGLTLTVDDIPDDSNDPDDSKYKGSLLPVLSKKLIINSLGVLYDMLLKAPDKDLVSEVTNYLNSAVYKMFRIIFSSCPKNQDKMFSIPDRLYSGYIDASMSRSEAELRDMLSPQPSGHSQINTDPFQTSSEKLTSDYPQLSSSLFNLIQQSEKRAK